MNNWSTIRVFNTDTRDSRPADVAHDIQVAWAICPLCRNHMCRECGCACSHHPQTGEQS